MNKFKIGLYVENTWGNPTSKSYIPSDTRGEIIDWVVELFATQTKEHECRYCGAMTTQSDEECFMANGKDFSEACEEFRNKYPKEKLEKMFPTQEGNHT